MYWLLLSLLLSAMFSLRPNPRYVPGGTENFWVSAATPDTNATEVRLNF